MFRGARCWCGGLGSVPHGRLACRIGGLFDGGQGGGVPGSFVAALFWGVGGFLPGLGDRAVRGCGDAFGFVPGPLHLGFSQQHAFGDVLGGDLVAVGAVDAAAGAAGAVIAVGAGDFAVAARAARRCAARWAHDDFEASAGGAVFEGLVGAAARRLGGPVVVGVPAVARFEPAEVFDGDDPSTGRGGHGGHGRGEVERDVTVDPPTFGAQRRPVLLQHGDLGVELGGLTGAFAQSGEPVDLG